MKKKLWHLFLLFFIAMVVTVMGCEKNTADPPDNGNSAPSHESGNSDGNSNGDPNGNETESSGETVYPPSDPGDPYENDKHWELP